MRWKARARNLIFSLLFLLFSGCGYNWKHSESIISKPGLYVPFIEGDEEGILTAEIISKIASSGIAQISNENRSHRLEVKILGQTNEVIGWRRDPQKIKNKIKKNLTGSEGRKNIDLEVAIFQGEHLYFGPVKISSWIDYDYVDGDSFQDLTFVNQEGQLSLVLPFSLGQLESVESAQDAASYPLYSQIAQKIVDAISAAW